MVSGASSYASGGSFSSGFLSRSLSSGIGSLTGDLGLPGRYIAGGLGGVIGSHIGGGSALAGLGYGLLVTAVNHEQHCPDCPIETTLDEIVITGQRLKPVIGSVASAAGWVGSGPTSAGAAQYGGGSWLGTNGRYYSNSWGGNGFKFKYSVGTRSYAKYSSKLLNRSGSVFGVPNMMYNLSNVRSGYKSGNAATTRIAISESFSAGIGAFGGVPGIGWTVGWETGRSLSKTNWYNNLFFGQQGRDGLISTENK